MVGYKIREASVASSDLSPFSSGSQSSNVDFAEFRQPPIVVKVKGTTTMARYSMPRSSYLRPECREQEPLRPEGTDLEIWLWEEGGHPYGIAFQGKSNKPLWHYRFTSEERRTEQVRATTETRREVLARKAADKAAKAAFKHDLKVGDIFTSSWGYDQTNVDFYEVTEVPSGKSVKLRPVGKTSVNESGRYDYVVPVPGSYCGDEFAKRVDTNGSVRISSYARASKWDGSPRYQTAFGWGH